MSEEISSPLRKWRNDQGYSLDQVCDMIKQHGLERPSAAKLSRIERDQVIPVEMIPVIEAITGISAKEQRPDLAKIFDGAAQ
jgi:transcriptional regulator with XRE-family HTH domain